MRDANNPAHIASFDTWHSGGGIELDIVELNEGPTLVLADDTIAVYRSADDFWAEVEDDDESHRTITLLRETGQPFELAGPR